MFFQKSELEELRQPGQVPLCQHCHSFPQCCGLQDRCTVRVERFMVSIDTPQTQVAITSLVYLVNRCFISISPSSSVSFDKYIVRVSGRTSRYQIKYVFNLIGSKRWRQHAPLLFPSFAVHRKQHFGKNRIYILIDEGTMIGKVIEFLHGDGLDQIEVTKYYDRRE